MSTRHSVAYLAFRTHESDVDAVMAAIASEADYYLDHNLISHTEIKEVLPEDNKVIVAAYMEPPIDSAQLQLEVVADTDYGFVRPDGSGKEYRMELFDGSFDLDDI